MANIEDPDTKKEIIEGYDDHIEAVTASVAIPQCPPGTTDGKLAWRTDYHVLPILFLMYTMAYLGEYLWKIWYY